MAHFLNSGPALNLTRRHVGLYNPYFRLAQEAVPLSDSLVMTSGTMATYAEDSLNCEANGKKKFVLTIQFEVMPIHTSEAIAQASPIGRHSSGAAESVSGSSSSVASNHPPPPRPPPPPQEIEDPLPPAPQQSSHPPRGHGDWHHGYRPSSSRGRDDDFDVKSVQSELESVFAGRSERSFRFRNDQ